MRRIVKFDYELYLKVVDLFKYLENNRTSDIAKILNITRHTTSYYIDVYLSLKKNYMGDKVTPPSSKFQYKKNGISKTNFSRKGKPVRVYEDGDLVGEFGSIKNAANFLGIYPTNISFKTYLLDKGTINHTSIKRRITYEFID